jgi:hypothetical protein
MFGQNVNVWQVFLKVILKNWIKLNALFCSLLIYPVEVYVLKTSVYAFVYLLRRCLLKNKGKCWEEYWT